MKSKKAGKGRKASKPKTSKAPATTGRPPIEISEKQWKQIETMARDMCTHQEIADFLGISKRTFYAAHLKERFESVTKMAAAATKWEVRKRQKLLALKGKAPLNVIQWGNVHLGQAPASLKVKDDGDGNRLLEATAGAEERLVGLLDALSERKKDA